jgi:glycosyltransferase involved in cell wall biosynthesis
MKTISVVTPCFNEAEGILDCVLAVRELFAKELSKYDYEHIFIDNCSEDGTVDILRKVAESDSRVRVIVNSRNFGLARSPYHALLQASGDAVIPIVADLQTPLDVIPKMVGIWESGISLVFASRKSTKVGLFQRFTQNIYYKLLRAVGARDHIPHFIGFGLFDRRVIQVIASFNDTVPYVRGTLTEVGFDKAIIEYDEPERVHGKSRHNFFDRAELASLGLTVSSPRPIYILILSGVITAAFAIVLAITYLIVKLLYWDQIDLGIAPILILTALIGSVQLVSIGLIGLYVEVILRHVRRRPLVIEKERINFPISTVDK